jgi:hypothetical protein
MKDYDYKDNVKEFKKELSWTFWKLLPLFIVIITILGAIGFGLNKVGLIGGTYVKRKVFENSYQRSESLKARIATDEAAIAEMKLKLKNPNLDNNTIYNLKAQISAAKIRINAAKRSQ